MQKETVVLKFDGEITGVEVNAFAHVMIDYATVAQAAAKTIDPLAAVDVDITAAERGCLQAVLQISPTTMKDAIDFAAANLPIALQVIETASSLYSLKKEIGKHGPVDSVSKDPSSIYTLKMHDGNTTVIDNRTFNLYSDPNASGAVNRSFKELRELSSVTGLEIMSKASPESDVRIERSEFNGIAESQIEPRADRREEFYDEQMLKIKRAILDEPQGRKWTFGWKGTPISAAITDAGFYERFPDMTFRMGDSLICDLKVYQEFNAAAGVYENKSYEVTKVHSKKEAPETMQMELPPDDTDSI